ncbi:hypothetical protein MMC19_004929 [Ptychographa xylographoides]|nr:hypothetical protein [Ptychographa xylographoides]
MHFSAIVVALAIGLCPLVATAPVDKRQILPLSANDESVLQLALFLENLERTLYTGGYEYFTDAQYSAEGFPPGFRENVGVIAEQEATHIGVISSILASYGVAPVPNCTYSFPYTSPTTFVNLANMITSVGIGAYIGGSTLLVDNPILLEDAASILPNEARHDAYLRVGIGASPFPTAFDTPLTAVFAYNLASMFVVSCPQYLPIILLPKLKLVSPIPPSNLQPPTPAGTILTFSWDPTTFFVPVDPSAPLYIAMINQISPPVFEEVTMVGEGMGTVPVPAGVGGVAFAVLTTFSGGLNETELTSFGTLAGPAEIVLA